jgi:hypothetical protein
MAVAAGMVADVSAESGTSGVGGTASSSIGRLPTVRRPSPPGSWRYCRIASSRRTGR